MSTVRVYTSTDPGAPPHPSDVRGSMAALLRACLVTGYGTGEYFKAPAGWEEPYPEVGYCACFRSLHGLARQFYQINDRDYAPAVSRMTSYDSMSSVEAGEGSRGAVYFGKWYTAPASIVWTVIADERTCYVVLDSQDNHIVHGFGEYLSLIDDDPCPAFISGHSSSGALPDDALSIPMHNGYDIGSTSAQAGYLRRCITEADPSSFAPLVLGVSSGYALGNIEDQYTSTAVVGVSQVFLPMVVKAINDVNAGIRQPCGIMRGVFIPLFKAPFYDYVTGDRVIFCVGIDAGDRNTGRLGFDVTGSWD